MVRPGEDQSTTAGQGNPTLAASYLETLITRHLSDVLDEYTADVPYSVIAEATTARVADDLGLCEGCGGSGVEMYVGWGNSVTERPCSFCDGTGRDPSPTGQLRDELNP